MDFTLYVNPYTCIKCGKCVRVCPAGIFSLPDTRKEAQINHPENCITCGHCVAVCPTDSVKHSLFPAEKVHPVELSQLPSPDALMLLIKSRRSNRAFSKKAVPREYIDRILEAAHRAPTASNGQEVEYTVVTDPEKLQLLIQFTADVFEEKVKRIGNPLVGAVVKRISPDLYRAAHRLKALTGMVKEGKDPILRGATGVIFIHSPREAYYGKADCNLAYQNGSLMAESLGVSQFYTGFICRAIDEDKKRRFHKLLGIEGTIHAGMAIGMPAFHYPKYIDRKEISVRKIE